MPITMIEAILRVLRDTRNYYGRTDCTQAIKCAEKALYSAVSSQDKLSALSELFDSLPDFSEPSVGNGLIALVDCYLRDYFRD